eukprot:Pgem_evm1s4356
MSCFICVEEYTNKNKKVTLECCQHNLCSTCLNKLDQCPFCNSAIVIENAKRRKEIKRRRKDIKIESDNIYLECYIRPVDLN